MSGTESTASGEFDIHATYLHILEDKEISHPLAAILALSELVVNSKGTFLPRSL
ncbi:hypothetical protein BDY19DRAFT_918064 [Irpex rosettiformis]|uniref:Uncharacterized protein n=1 Tax=Irpex rosettiformis TaxID=378272 RepID=A0ACB8UHB4_9APHY|nr:hypothetical protein BDY19DRAFT_918064 [Irpex rosettiformis]